MQNKKRKVNFIMTNENTVNYKEIIDGYISEADWRVKENSSVNYSLGGLILGNSGAMTASYWLNNVFDKESADAHINGDIHIHDLSMLSPYCAGWSLKQLIEEGLNGVESKIASAPAKHFSTICNQIVNFLGILQNEWAGAQAFSSVDTLLAPFIKKDNLSYEQVKQSVQNLVFGLNVSSRWGCQCPFTNFTFDWTVPDDLSELPAIVGGEEQDFKYKDCKKEMDMFNKAFLEVMIEGDANGREFAYPIPTYSITKEFDWEETENNKLLFEMAAKYGTPYFSNYVNSDMKPSDIRSMCCRLRLDLNELRRKNGGFFGSGDKTGSVCVVTINMPRLAYKANDIIDFFNSLDKMMDISARVIEERRAFLTDLMAKNLFPYTKRYLGNFDNHFSTIGLIGMNEACMNANWIKKNLTDKKAQDFTESVLNHMRNRLVIYQEKYGHLFNLEATPAESTTYRFGKKDKELYPDIITASEETPYYTNSSHLPVNATEDVFDALDIQDNFQPLYTSGTVFHAFLGEKLPNWKSAMELVRKIAENYKLPYFTLSPTYSVCKKHGYIEGEVYECPQCHEKTEVYSRITGYYRPVQNWNKGKAQEFKDRKTYEIEKKNSLSSSLNNQLEKKETEDKENNRESTLEVIDDFHPFIQIEEKEKEEQKEDKKEELEGQEVFKDIFTEELPSNLFIITTPTCPKCKVVKNKLKNKGIRFTELDGTEENYFTKTYHIKTAPCLIEKKGEYVAITRELADILRKIDLL
jgi:ribonucleoside-triphosphate reductase (formate)